jgi:hypothetical protein
MDLAAADTAAAKVFYNEMFGWTAHDEPANGGFFTRLRLSGRDVGSLYQLKRAQLESGVPSHWTPYVRVDDVQEAAERAASLGGEIIVRPIAVADLARVALIVDAVGAPLGLWQHGR